MAETYDAVVIGAGPGGYSCAIRLGQLGQKVLCVERDEQPGGVCLNWGCIPSKALISTAHLYEQTRRADARGLRVASVALDVPAMQAWKRGIVAQLTGSVRTLLRANGAELAFGAATIVGPGAVQIAPRAAGEPPRTVQTRAVVVATGASTVALPQFPFDGELILGARDAVSLERIPKHLVVIGGGVIGLELGSMFQAFGAELTVIEASDALLPGTDPDCVAVVERRLVRRGARIFKRARALGYERLREGAAAVRVELADGGLETLTSDAVLVAVGMRPNARGLGLEALGVELDTRGFVPTDDTGRTRAAGVYAIGDVAGGPLLAHKAMKEAEVVAEVIAGHRAGKDWRAIPAAVFTDPEIATVGLTEAQARARGIDVRVGRMPFAASGRARAAGETEGFVKTVADAASGQVLGVHIVGPSASDLISEGALAVEMGAHLQDVALTIHPHPTLGESVMISAQHALGQAVDILNR